MWSQLANSEFWAQSHPAFDMAWYQLSCPAFEPAEREEFQPEADYQERRSGRSVWRQQQYFLFAGGGAGSEKPRHFLDTGLSVLSCSGIDF